MAFINVLDKKVAELIAAGEVIERPASVIKELIENSIDAGSKNITVEINGGGIKFIRVTDDGCGISHEEIPTAFLRHATSKVQSQDDLESIATMGFRGEALPSISAVSRIELLSKKANDDFGSVYKIEGGIEISHDKTGCPDGTTIIIRDLFYNTPARLKFLKKDVSEGNTVQAIVDKLALSHPEIAFRFIRDNKPIIITGGDGKYISAIYAVFGKQFASSLIPVDFEQMGIKITGYISSPLFSRGNRSTQYFFVNTRYIKSLSCMAALEEGYRNSIMTGKFPACVLNIEINPSEVDVNVHPAKTEVRFANDRAVFDTVYFAVKNAILNNDNVKEVKIESKPITYTEKEVQKPTEQITFSSSFTQYTEKSTPKTLIDVSPKITKYENRENINAETEGEPKSFKYITNESTTPKIIHKPIEDKHEKKESINKLCVIGELWGTYIVCEDNSAKKALVLIDKHAAHERINFERLKSEFLHSSQLLAESIFISLDMNKLDLIMQNKDFLLDIGIEILISEKNKIEVIALPSILSSSDPEAVINDTISILEKGIGTPRDTLFGDILHSIACRSSIKAHDKSDLSDLSMLANKVYNDESIRFCPHGRPIITSISKSEIEKNFGRT